MICRQDIEAALQSPAVSNSLLVLRTYRESFLEGLKEDFSHEKPCHCGCGKRGNFDQELEHIANQTRGWEHSSWRIRTAIIGTSEESKSSLLRLNTFVALCKHIYTLELQACKKVGVR